MSIYRIPLSNGTFEGDNNVYLFADGPETVLVDTGDWLGATREQLVAGLADRGVAPSAIDRILLTHWHPDHTGLAGQLQAESGATVHVHTADAPLVAGDGRAWGEMQARQQALFDAWKMPAGAREALADRLGETTDREQPDPTVESFEGGDTIQVNDHELVVVHASGHAKGLCMFELSREGSTEVLSSDALLPKYTPNVGGADVRVAQPLSAYLGALEGMIAADYDRAWPGHRAPIEHPTDRAQAIIDHHEERAWRVLDVLSGQRATTTWEVSAALFGELEGIHILHGPGEAHAHLDHLQDAGTIVADERGYRCTPETDQALVELDTARWPLRR